MTTLIINDVGNYNSPLEHIYAKDLEHPSKLKCH